MGNTFVIDGRRFTDLEGFYDEISREFMGGIVPRYEHEGHSVIYLDPEYWGRNLDALNDLLHGDMGRLPGLHEPFTVRWLNSAESREWLGAVFATIVEIFQRHDHITLELE